MALKRFAIAVLMALVTLATNGVAQKNELAGIIGRTFISNQGIKGATFFNNEVRFGNGLTFEANYGRRLLGGGFATLTFEVPAVFNLDEDLNAGINTIPESFRSYFVTPSARVNLFAGAAISPWVSVGGGFGHFSESDTLVFGGSNPGKTGTNSAVFQIGGGLDVKIFRSFTLRGEVRDFNSGVPQLNVDTGKSRQHNYFVGGGIVWLF